MEGLIEALTIFLKYVNTKYPTQCEHDVLIICNLDLEVSEKDKKRLDQLGFFESEEYDGWISFKYGSC